ncbi:LLM class flavin-dependent oxidoreductase [Streptomyces fuscigenes]|uniref:LLM class flavin-dependent oxidoreductase n=1 Tax=Streptomyces fuscigenes TaxID=1528880 RepID=UPI001F412D0F|nr:LLM class flavin-dependent oxidoreductase [Streptomyces fuscigenes]MCF3964804.1 LLM class flavin-dependent oxidoreductase [Streptomyces fuscigenes]
MKIGIGLPNHVRGARAEILPEWARRAEQAGFSSLGTIGRIAYPGVMDTVALAAAAGATSRIGLVTSILVAPTWPATLLAKEVASVDGVSGGRLTLGIGLGGRPDDFTVEGLGPRGLGRRLDRDVETYKRLWAGGNVEGSINPAVPDGTRSVPLLFGGMAQAAFDRVARHGEGYLGAAVPPPMLAPAFDGVRAAWRAAGRSGDPRFVAITYFAFTDVDRGRENERDYYSVMGDEMANAVAQGVSGGADAVRATRAAFEEIGTDELIFLPSTDDIDDIGHLADTVL